MVLGSEVPKAYTLFSKSVFSSWLLKIYLIGHSESKLNICIKFHQRNAEMNTRKVLKDALKGCDRGEVARFIGISLGSLNNQVAGELPYSPKGNSPNILDRAYALIDIVHETTGDISILEKLAEEFGYLLIENPAITTTETPAIQQIAAILKEFSSVIEEISTANADGRIEPPEAGRIRSKWEVMKRITEEFVLACETGKYNRTEESND